MRDVKTYKVCKTFISVSILLTALLPNGCWGFPVPRGDTPEVFTESKKTIRSMLGATTEEVIDTVGRPAFIAYKDNKTYYIYEWRSDESCIVIFGYVPMPDLNTSEGTELHCILLEFGHDRRLSSYKADTDSCSSHDSGLPPVYCAEVFGMITIEEYKYNQTTRVEHSDDPIADWKWKLNKEIGTYCPYADLGYTEAQAYIGDLHYLGAYGLEKNLLQAYVWYSLAAKGNSYASGKLDKLTNELSPQQLNEAQIQLEAWEPGQCARDLMEAISEGNK